MNPVDPMECYYTPLRRLVVAILDEDDVGVHHQLTEEGLVSMLATAYQEEDYFIDLVCSGISLPRMSSSQADLLLMALQHMSLSYSSMEKLIKVLPPKGQISLLDQAFSAAEDYRGLSGACISLLCEHSLYGVSMLHHEILIMQRTEVVSACQRLGPEWDHRIGRCFAAKMPSELISDESFWVDALSHVRDDGLNLQFLARVHDSRARKRIACSFAKVYPRCIINTTWASFPEVVVHAIRRQEADEGIVSIVDDAHPSLRTNLDFVEEVAETGGASFLFHTRLGAYYSTSTRVVLASLKGFKPEDILLLPGRLHPLLQKNPMVMAHVVSTIYSKRELLLCAVQKALDTMRKYANVHGGEELEEFHMALVSSDPRCLRLLPEEKRGCRKIVTHAVRSNKEALKYAHASIWLQTSIPGDIDEGMWQLVADLLALGCGQEDIPAKVLRALGHEDTPGSFAAEILLRNRGAWEKLTPEQTSSLGQCSEFLCSICYQLPQEVFRCRPIAGPPCSAHYCFSCSERLISAGHGSRCAHCRQSQLRFGEKDDSARSSEATITYTLLKACRPAQKKRRIQ